MVTFACQNCSLTFPSIHTYNKHQILHRHIENLKIPCVYPTCRSNLTSYNSFKTHVYRCHGNNSEGCFKCIYRDCKYTCRDWKTMKLHLKNHVKKNEKSIECGFCLEKKYTFNTYNAYKIHLSRYHQNLYEECSVHTHDDSQCDNITNPDEPMDIVQDTDEVSESNLNEVSTGMDFSKEQLCEQPSADTDGSSQMPDRANVTMHQPCEKPTAETILSNLYVRLSAKNFVPESTIHEIVDSYNSVFKICKDNFSSSVMSSDLSEDSKNSLKEMFHKSCSSIIDTHAEKTGVFRSTYTRNEHHRENLRYIRPVVVPLTHHCTDSEFHYSYVPILDTLKLMLNDKNVLHHCNCDVPSTSDRGGLSDIVDGNVVKGNPFFRDNPKSLKIILFQDAFELCNPLGSAKTKNKVIGLYMMLANLPPHLRSKIDNIKLVALCKEKYVNEFGWKRFLDKLLQDLKLLETEGITIVVENKTMLFKGSVVAVTGDNLGSHQIGGFSQGFRAGYCCRFCERSVIEMHKDVFSTKPLRTVGSYEECADEANRKNKAVKGVKCNSCLNELNHYHVCNPGLPPCVAHDIFEGIGKHDMWLAINYFIKKKWFRLGFVNYRLKHVKLSTEPSMYIPDIKAQVGKKPGKLCGTAAQIRRLIMIFPLAVSDVPKLDVHDDVWKMVLHLREICNLAYAHELSIDQVAVMQSEIKEYLQLRTKCFPQIPLRPKHEFVQHYPDLTLHFGPLRRMSTLPFEHKHQYFINAIKHLKNFKNVTKLLADKHELMQSSLNDQYSDVVLVEEAVQYKETDYTHEMNYYIRKLQKENGLEYLCKKIVYRGINYSNGMSLCMGKTPYGNFLACTIDMILVDRDYTKVFFIGKSREIIYNVHLGIYENNDDEGENQSTFSYFPYSALLSPDPLAESEIKFHKVYFMKYAPFDHDL